MSVFFGEVLGIGERDQAVDPAAISIRYTEGESKWQATMNADLEQCSPWKIHEGERKRADLLADIMAPRCSVPRPLGCSHTISDKCLYETAYEQLPID